MHRVEEAAGLGVPALARLMTDAYEGYALPVRMDPASLEAFVRERDVDLARSRVLHAGKDPVGLALVGVRRERANLCAIGIVPAARGGGAGRRLLDAVVESVTGARVLTLEVLDANAPARALYAKAGFTVTRQIPCYRARALVGRNTDVKEVPLAEGRRRALALAPDAPPLPWPNAWRAAARAQARAYAHPAAGVLVAKWTPRGLVVYAVVGPDPGTVVDGFATLHAGEAASFLNVADPAVARALDARGWERFAEQVEMARAL